MKQAFILISIAGLLAGSIHGFAHATMMNRDFSAGLTGWTTEDINSSGIGTSPSASISIVNGQAVLETQGFNSDVVLVSLFQSVMISELAVAISFDIGFMQSGVDSGGSGFGFPDFFQVSYLDAVDSSFDRGFVGLDDLGPFDPLTSAPLTLTDLGNELFRFTTNIADLRGRSGTLFFDLFDEDDGWFSIAKVDNVHVQVVPEPGTILLLGSGLFGLIGMWIGKRIGNIKPLFRRAPSATVSTGGHPSLLTMAASPACRDSPPQRLTARRDAAMQGLDR